MRQVVLDTETTGLAVEKGHRVVEIGCVELRERRSTERIFHRYLNPQRVMDAGAQNVHGLSDEFLADKPLFAEIADDFVAFVEGAELIIHNAAFDIGFLDAELARLDRGIPQVSRLCQITDSLELARERYPGQRNGLDALCKRLLIENAHRTFHGALLDAQLLAEVYLALTAGQGSLFSEFNTATVTKHASGTPIAAVLPARRRVKVISASVAERADHAARLVQLRKAGRCLWD
jgi:DNA polymerase-3 subunit epsilon